MTTEENPTCLKEGGIDDNYHINTSHAKTNCELVSCKINKYNLFLVLLHYAIHLAIIIFSMADNGRLCGVAKYLI